MKTERIKIKRGIMLFPSTKHLRPTEILYIPLRYLSRAVLLNSSRVYVSVQNSSVHTPNTIFFPSTFKNPKSANFLVKILITNHCKSSGSKFLRSSNIKYQVMYHLNSSHVARFCTWFV